MHLSCTSSPLSFLNRFARSLKNLLTMLQDLDALGVTFVSHKDHIDLSTPSGRLMAQMIGAFAEFEAALIKERVVAGLREAKRKGVRLGRPIELDRDKAIELRARGKSYAAIAAEIGCSKAGIFKVLNAK
jgi:DNA invertase Pin-like site-specific DNA recombinase